MWKNHRSRTGIFEKGPSRIDFFGVHLPELFPVFQLNQALLLTRNRCNEITDVGASYLKKVSCGCSSLRNVALFIYG